MSSSEERPFISRYKYATATAFVAFVVGCGLLWNGWLKDRFTARNFAVLDQGLLYRSGQISRFQLENIAREYNIRTIVFLSEDKDLVEGADRPDVKAERDLAARLGISRYNCPLAGDGTGDISQYATAIEMAVLSVRENKPALIHCHTGSQRTGAAIAFYRLLVEKRDPTDVLNELERYGHNPRENPKLVPYVNHNIAKMEEPLMERSTIQRTARPDIQLPTHT